jgi:hypothetical protein
MKKYRVTLYYHSYIEVEVEADDRDGAVDEAYFEVGKGKYDSQLLHNVQSCDDADVEEITEEG